MQSVSGFHPSVPVTSLAMVEGLQKALLCDDEVWDAPLVHATDALRSAAVYTTLDADAQAPQICANTLYSCFGSEHVAALPAMS